MAFVSICISSRGLETGQTPELKHGSTPPPPSLPPFTLLLELLMWLDVLEVMMLSLFLLDC